MILLWRFHKYKGNIEIPYGKSKLIQLFNPIHYFLTQGSYLRIKYHILSKLFNFGWVNDWFFEYNYKRIKKKFKKNRYQL